jgi:hypothetical protein
MIAPVVVTWLSTSRSGLSARSSRKTRLPPPTTTGSIMKSELVDQVMLDQRVDQLRAADHVQVLAIPLLQSCDGLGDVTLQHLEFCHGPQVIVAYLKRPNA